jgi:hypothetical protein
VANQSESSPKKRKLSQFSVWRSVNVKWDLPIKSDDNDERSGKNGNRREKFLMFLDNPHF